MEQHDAWVPIESGDVATDRAAAARFAAALPQAAGLARRAARLRVCCRLRIGALETLLAIEAGVPSLRRPHPAMNSVDFTVAADAATWQRHWERPPAPGWHDLLALCKVGRMRVDGDLHPLMSHLQYFKDLFALPRDVPA